MKLSKGVGIREDTRERKRGSMKNYFEKKNYQLEIWFLCFSVSIIAHALSILRAN